MNTYADEVKQWDGQSAKVLMIACQEFEKKLNVNWREYVVKLNETETTYTVKFQARNLPEGLRGSPKGVPGFEIQISKDQFKVLNSQFIR